MVGGKLWRAILLISWHDRDREFMPAFKLKLSSTFVLALVEEMLTPLNSLYFSTQLSLKILARAKQNCQKNAAISLLNYSTWRKQGTSPNRLLCFSDVMLTCQGKLGEFIPASKLASTFMPTSKLASTFVLALIEEKSTPLNFSYFSTRLSLKISRSKAKFPKECLHFTVE